MKANHINFTEKTLASLPTPLQGKNQEVYYDTGSNVGLCVIITYGGTKTYYAYMKYMGMPRRTKIGRVGLIKLVEARAKALELKVAADKGDDPSKERRDILRDITFKTFYETYYKPRHTDTFKKLSSCRKDDSIFDNYLTDFYGRKMTTITRDDIERLHLDLNKRLSPYTANRMLSLVRHMYNKAIEWGVYPTGRGNPTSGIRKFPEKSRDRFLSPDELQRFFRALAAEQHTQFRDFILLLLFIGQRTSNIIALRWDDIDLQNGFVYFADTKNNEPQQIPLTSHAIAVLSDMKSRATDNGWLFPAPWAKESGKHIESFRNPWLRFLQMTGLENLRMHDLRRTLGSYQAISGASLHIIGKSLGHKATATTNVYARLSADPVRDSMQKATDKMIGFFNREN